MNYMSQLAETTVTKLPRKFNSYRNRFKTIKERFAEKIIKDAFVSSPHVKTPCWIWHGCRIKGYGSMKVDGKNVPAHRQSWILKNGKIPDGFLICHHCDNPPCVNPRHLFIGDNFSNMRDMSEKGRAMSGDRSYAKRFPERLKRGINHPFVIDPSLAARGEDAGQAKLTEIQVREIRKVYRFGKWGFGAHVLAKRYGVTKGTILAVLKFKTWKHIK